MNKLKDALVIAAFIVVFVTMGLIALLLWAVRSVLEREPEDEYDR